MFKLQSPSKYFPFDAIHLLRRFSPLLNSSWTCRFWWLLVFLPFLFVCLFHLFHIDKMFPFENFFHLGKQKIVAQGEIRWIGRVVIIQGRAWINAHVDGPVKFRDVEDCWELDESKSFVERSAFRLDFARWLRLVARPSASVVYRCGLFGCVLLNISIVWIRCQNLKIGWSLMKTHVFIFFWNRDSWLCVACTPTRQDSELSRSCSV